MRNKDTISETYYLMYMLITLIRRSSIDTHTDINRHFERHDPFKFILIQALIMIDSSPRHEHTVNT